MWWLVFALLAPLIWAFSNLIDDDLVLHRLKNPNVLVGMTGLFAIVPAMFLFIFGFVATASWHMMVFGMATGVLSLLVYYPYFRALESTHPANTILLWNLSPILVVVAAFLFLDERLSFEKYVAIALILCSTIILETAQKSRKKHRMELRAFYWMILASVGAALQVILEKKLFMMTSLPTGIAFIALGSFITGTIFFLFPNNRMVLKKAFAKSGRLLLLNELLEIAAVLCASAAISLGPVSLVMAIGGSQAIFILLLSWVVGKVFTRKQFRLAESPSIYRVSLACLCVIFGLMMIG